ncbi:unnamed protein product [Eretmochelys imbricata]
MGPCSYWAWQVLSSSLCIPQPERTGRWPGHLPGRAALYSEPVQEDMQEPRFTAAPLHLLQPFPARAKSCQKPPRGRARLPSSVLCSPSEPSWSDSSQAASGN